MLIICFVLLLNIYYLYIVVYYNKENFIANNCGVYQSNCSHHCHPSTYHPGINFLSFNLYWGCLLHEVDIKKGACSHQKGNELHFDPSCYCCYLFAKGMPIYWHSHKNYFQVTKIKVHLQLNVEGWNLQLEPLYFDNYLPKINGEKLIGPSPNR